MRITDGNRNHSNARNDTGYYSHLNGRRTHQVDDDWLSEISAVHDICVRCVIDIAEEYAIGNLALQSITPTLAL